MATGINDVDRVKNHYNSVENLDLEWRKKESRIKGLRAFNNWIKCVLIQKFATTEGYNSGAQERRLRNGKIFGGSPDTKGIRVLDIGCEKGGDLHKWQKAPQKLELFVGLDPAEVSIEQAKERWARYQRVSKHGEGLFRAKFYTQDCFGETIESIPAVKEVGFDRGGGGGFDIVSMMFCMHYAFENEGNVRIMLENIAGALKRGGKLIGCVPNSDVISRNVQEFNTSVREGNKKEEEKGEPREFAEWGNDIYNIRFPDKTPLDGIFQRLFGHKYYYFLTEAVEAPEYVVPWEAFCALAEEYNLKLQYCKPFDEVWADEKNDEILAPLSKEMGVRDSCYGPLLMSEQEIDAANFYIAFAFHKVQGTKTF